MKSCAYCGRENQDNASHCFECGTGEFVIAAHLDAMATLAKKPHWPRRILLLMFVGIPGAWCAAMGGSSLGAALFGPEHDEASWFLSLLLVPSLFLLLYGTGTLREPLFLLVFLPMPVLMSAGYNLREFHSGAFGPLVFVGIVMPLLAYPFVSRYYRRRRLKDKVQA
jgi:hypothetical protein